MESKIARYDAVEEAMQPSTAQPDPEKVQSLHEEIENLAA